MQKLNPKNYNFYIYYYKMQLVNYYYMLLLNKDIIVFLLIFFGICVVNLNLLTLVTYSMMGQKTTQEQVIVTKAFKNYQ